MAWRPVLILLALLMAGCSAPIEPPGPAQSWRSRVSHTPPSPAGTPAQPLPKPSAFVPGVEGRGADEVCQSNSAECQSWTELARKCEENMRARDAGDMSPQQPYCTQAEALRERITGLQDSSAPGAYRF